MPYMQQCFSEVLDMIDYPSECVKKAAIGSLGKMCCALHEQSKTDEIVKQGKLLV